MPVDMDSFSWIWNSLSRQELKKKEVKKEAYNLTFFFFWPQSRGTFLEQGIHIIFSFKHGSFLMNLFFRTAWPATQKRIGMEGYRIKLTYGQAANHILKSERKWFVGKTKAKQSLRSLHANSQIIFQFT